MTATDITWILDCDECDEEFTTRLPKNTLSESLPRRCDDCEAERLELERDYTAYQEDQ